MPDRAIDPDSEPAEEPEPAAALGSAAPSDTDAAGPADRRAFLRQLSTDAVWTAGKVAGASAAFRRTILAAGGTAIGAFDPVVEREDAVVSSSASPVTSEPAAIGPATASPHPAPRQAPDPVAALTPEQHAFLADGPKASLGVNDPAGPPLLAFTTYHWDGEVIRVPARDFTARTINIDLDRRVGLIIGDPASEAWVSMHGIASLVYGAAVEAEMRLILAKYHGEDDVTRRWDELRLTGDPVVIRIRPTRFVWRPA